MSKFDFLLDCVNGRIPSFQTFLLNRYTPGWVWREVRLYQSNVLIQSKLGISYPYTITTDKKGTN